MCVFEASTLCCYRKVFLCLKLTLFLPLIKLQGNTVSISCAKTYAEKCFSLIFLVQEQRIIFHVWGNLQKIEKTKIEKRNTFLAQPS